MIVGRAQKIVRTSNGPLSKQLRYKLELQDKIRTSTGPLSKQLRGVICMQACVRGWLIRNRVL